MGHRKDILRQEKRLEKLLEEHPDVEKALHRLGTGGDRGTIMMRYEWLVDTLMTVPHGVGCEIGVENGDTSEYVLQNLSRLKRYYLIDPWTHEGTHEWHNAGRAKKGFEQCMERLQPYMDRVVLLRKRSMAARTDIPASSLDWIFIDGDHRPESVRQDLDLADMWTHRGAFIAGHDYESRKGAWDVKGEVLERYDEDDVGRGPDGVWFVWKK